MAVLRSGKITRSNINAKKNRSRLTHKYNLKEFHIKVKRLSEHEIKLLTRPKKNNLRHRQTLNIPIESKNSISIEKSLQPLSTKGLKKVATSKIIWQQLTSHHYEFVPTELVLAKMNNFRPWPAKINSVYKVGNVFKCCVLFYGTFQIGSVLKSECVKISDCHLYLHHAVREIKERFKWDLDYEQISKTEESDRFVAIFKLTQAQKFLLSVRDIEHIQKVPLISSMIQNA